MTQASGKQPNHPASPRWHYTSYAVRLVVGTMLANLFVVVMAAFFLYQLRVEGEQRAEETTKNLAHVLAHNIGGTIDKINLTLLAATDEIERQLAHKKIEQLKLDSYLSRMQVRVPELNRILVTNAKGDIVFGGDASVRPRNSVAQRDYFITLRDDPGVGLAVGKPAAGVIDGKWIEVVARRINNPDGSFAGIVTGSIPLEHFLELFRSIHVGEHGSITLRDKDLAIVARYPEPQGVGSTVGLKTISDTFRKLIESGTTGATFKAVYPVDNIERTYSFLKIPITSHYINVGLASAPLLSEWRHEAMWVSALVVLFVLSTCASSSLLIGKWKRERHFEKSLKESEFFFRESQRAASIGSYKTDFTTGRWESSEVLDSVFGIDKNYSRTVKGWLDLVHPDDKASMERYLAEEVISRRKPFSREYRIIRGSDGETRWVKGLGEATFDDAGAILSLIGTIQDISDQKRLEFDHKELEKQLVQTQKLESLGVLAGGIAHDFNNILTVIVGYCAMTRLRPKEAQGHIANIEKAAERAAELCRQMLAYAGKVQLVQSECAITSLVEETVAMLRPTLPPHVVITLDSAADVPAIKGDLSQIRQIVMNLVINASEAIGEEQGNITVSLARLELTATPPEHDHLGKAILPGCYVRLEVADSGCGMADETKQRIFEPFFTTKFTGRGLGMSAVLGIVTAHNGALQLFSTPGRGTIFRVYLPGQITTAEMTQDQLNGPPQSPRTQGYV